VTNTTATNTTMTGVRTLLLSLRPRFAEAILSGAKTVELRRRPVNAQPGTPILLYASSPTMAIVGTARLRGVHTLTPNTAWRTHADRLSLTRAEFYAYLDGSPRAHLLLLHQVCVLNEPLYLHQLRQEGQFQPPQSFRYVTSSDPAPLHDLVSGSVQGDLQEAGRPRTVQEPAVRRSTPPAPLPVRTARAGIGRHQPTSKIVDS
jgi:predicted transcriptional regulator